MERETSGIWSDGESVNMGKRNGVAAKLKDEVEHLITIHCIAHRLELAANNAIKNHQSMKKVQDILQHIYKHYHYSPKALRELRQIGESLEEKVMKPGNLGGTRWLPHIERALQILSKNYKVLLAHFEHVMTARSGTAEVQGRATFVTKLLKDYDFLYFVFFIQDILSALSFLSQKFQRDDLTLSEMLDCLTTTQLSLIELKYVDGKALDNFLHSVENNTYQGVELKPKVMKTSIFRNKR